VIYSMDAKDLKTIHRIINTSPVLNLGEKSKILEMVEREIRLKKMVPSYTEEKNDEIFHKFMREK